MARIVGRILARPKRIDCWFQLQTFPFALLLWEVTGGREFFAEYELSEVLPKARRKRLQIPALKPLSEDP